MQITGRSGTIEEMLFPIHMLQEDAVIHISRTLQKQPRTAFAIAAKGEAIGSIGLLPGKMSMDWGRKLKEMIKRKRGAPYKYPNTFMTFASIMYSFFRMPYRQLEGFIGRISACEP